MSWPDILANDAIPEQVPGDAQNRRTRAAVSVYTVPNGTDGDRTFRDAGNTATPYFESKPRRPALNRSVNNARAVNATNRTECPKRRLARADVFLRRWQAGRCCRNGKDQNRGKCWDMRGHHRPQKAGNQMATQVRGKAYRLPRPQPSSNFLHSRRQIWAPDRNATNGVRDGRCRPRSSNRTYQEVLSSANMS